MRTLRRLIDREVYRSVALVTLGFVALFFFFDLVEELKVIQQKQSIGYGYGQAMVYLLLLIPNHIFELLPITVLIGTVFVMARLAQSSEFTVLRTCGLGPYMALRQLARMGLIFIALTWLMGDYLAPWAERQAQNFKSRAMGESVIGHAGAWLRERGDNWQQTIHIRSAHINGEILGVRIFEFDAQGRFKSMTQAARGEYQTESDQWLLKEVQRRQFQDTLSDGATQAIEQLPLWRWPTRVTPEMVSVALLNPDRMRTLDLFRYIRYLQTNDQSSQRYEIVFWNKVFYPISCLVMIVLALPFAYLHMRSGQIANLVFIGVMVGVSFFLLNNVFGHIGNLRQWSPWLAAALPGLIYTFISLLAFGWLVVRQ